ncbi:myogenesis-regulating glycosidase-like isoform X1 [Haliotis rubra]|uniref:myogenesis-regulating glycosidase-like isoform X1 n=2 Tax=Haliotis rubra TaxID=36100 RepID=UPI001EE5651B|nr:myogenesis-regulating glycosidase-like isoform X1 [Haliotis rubra]
MDSKTSEDTDTKGSEEESENLLKDHYRSQHRDGRSRACPPINTDSCGRFFRLNSPATRRNNNMSQPMKGKDINVPLVREPNENEPVCKTKLAASSLDNPDGPQSEEAVQAQESKRRKRRIMKVAVYFMFGIIALGVFAIWLFHKDNVAAVKLDESFTFTVKMRTLELENNNEDTIMYGDLGMHLKATSYHYCWDEHRLDYDMHCLLWRKMATLHFSKDDNETLPCYTLEWKGLSDNFKAEDCYYLLGFKWYGLITDKHGIWPMSKLIIKNATFYPKYPVGQKRNRIPMWLSSKGVALFVDSNTPFLISVNTTEEQQFCMLSEFAFDDVGLGGSLLKYTICRGTDMKDAYHKSQQHIRENYGDDLGPKVGKVIPNPVRALLSEDDIPEMRDQLVASKTQCSYVEIFWDWENETGDLQFNSKKLQKLQTLLDDLAGTDCKVLMPVSTLFTYRSKHFMEGMDNDYFLRDEMDIVTKMIKWRGKEGAVLDVTNPDAIQWFQGLLEKLVEDYNIAGFKLLHIEIPRLVTYMDKNVTFLDYPRLFAEVVSAMNTSVVLDYVAGFTPESVFTSIHAELFEINGAKCFNTVIPLALQNGMGGYPNILLDGLAELELSKELFARWLQLAAFFPGIRIPMLSILSEEDVEDLLESALKLRQSILTYIETAAQNQKGDPIIRPVWWMEPNDPVAQNIDDQFMVGDVLMVAPVLCEGKKTRSVYLPKGKWRSSGNKPIEGGQTITINVKDITNVPHFFKIP